MKVKRCTQAETVLYKKTVCIHWQHQRGHPLTWKTKTVTKPYTRQTPITSPHASGRGTNV